LFARRADAWREAAPAALAEAAFLPCRQLHYLKMTERLATANRQCAMQKFESTCDHALRIRILHCGTTV
jgi:hypothetical protein